MSYGKADGRITIPLFTATWKSILDQIAPLIVNTSPQHHPVPCGGFVEFTCKQSLG